jgi:guanine nucleotide-binding protein alpha-1 subunit
LDRVTAPNYLPTDGTVQILLSLPPLPSPPLPSFSLFYIFTNIDIPDDVLKARLKTIGVTEYNFSLQHRYPEYQDWRVFDVGGTRCQVKKNSINSRILNELNSNN